ncbi:hypothetical protein OB236_38925 [Paenibacillus sp. WQ 127069]|uniref:Uncharacterized protein n=1 Tax=Paenibacillus baimaensis TaxID=2982185 RepID=A0ABT2UWD5_9BACL|nr:hypothetical protein [Paenibacillus sp. WQ 127069]
MTRIDYAIISGDFDLIRNMDNLLLIDGRMRPAQPIDLFLVDELSILLEAYN